jgi:hypothetical protein
MGSTTVTNAYIQVGWTTVSDLRDKNNLGEVPHGLDFVMKLNPIKYQFKTSRTDSTPNGPVRYGFGAQDILEQEGDSPVVIDASDSEKLRLTESNMLPILVKALQELKAEFEAYKASHP